MIIAKSVSRLDIKEYEMASNYGKEKSWGQIIKKQGVKDRALD